MSLRITHVGERVHDAKHEPARQAEPAGNRSTANSFWISQARVLRQARLLRRQDEAESLLTALEAECWSKGGYVPRLGGFRADFHGGR